MLGHKQVHSQFIKLVQKIRLFLVMEYMCRKHLFSLHQHNNQLIPLYRFTCIKIQQLAHYNLKDNRIHRFSHHHILLKV